MQDRYRKNKLVEGVGEIGQTLLSESKVVIVGLGGLGSIVSTYLLSAGLGKILLIDPDHVCEDNLQRQIIYNMEDLGRLKAEIALEYLSKKNHDIDIEISKTLWQDSKDLISSFQPDIIIDCVDKINVKFELNDFSIENNYTLVHAGVVAMQGQVTTIIPGATGCLRCIFSSKVPEETSSDKFGVLGPSAGVIGSIQALEVIKLITGINENLKGKILSMDMRSNKYKILKYKQDLNCICRRA